MSGGDERMESAVDAETESAVSHEEELARLAQVCGVSEDAASAVALCGRSLDAGLVTLADLRETIAHCRTWGELDGVLTALAADLFLAGVG